MRIGSSKRDVTLATAMTQMADSMNPNTNAGTFSPRMTNNTRMVPIVTSTTRAQAMREAKPMISQSIPLSLKTFRLGSSIHDLLFRINRSTIEYNRPKGAFEPMRRR
ncbi:MAG: hypothetical protein BWY82_02395 [Verrucomicrobia bacterium ADurb.Bin474]|nr:MAG: hypothetical protein BWY82_02395 [Verrucomicrobia bacterium ADurb.Bin474]